MKYRRSISFAVILAANGSGVLSAQNERRTWTPLPVSLWAQVAVVPPGTNDTRRTETLPGTTTPPPAAETTTPPTPPPGNTGPGQTPAVFPTTPPQGVPTVPVGSVTPGRLPDRQAPNPNTPANCKISLDAAETSVDPGGGTVTFAPRFVPPSCATEPASTVSWIRRSAASNNAGYIFTVDANSTRMPRQGELRVGDVSMTVKQEAGKFAPFAAAPSRLEFSIGEKTLAKQTIAAWSDQAGVAFAATTPTPWLKVTPVVRNTRAGAQKFTVELAPADLKPGHHQGSIEITSPGAVNEPIRIPVVVTVAEKPK